MEEERGPGLDFSLCFVLFAAVVREGLPLFCYVCLLIIKCV